MGYDKDLAEHNRAMTTLRTTIEERDKERENNKKIEAERKEIDSAIRELCEIIISKRDMNSGSDKTILLKTGAVSYKKLPTKKLINEAKNARKEYDEARTALMKELHKQNSDLKLECTNLKEHEKINQEALAFKAEEIHSLRKKLIEKGQSSIDKGNPKVETKTHNIKVSSEESQRTTQILNEANTLAQKSQNKKLGQILQRLNKEKSGKMTATEKEREIEDISQKISQGGATWEKAKLIFGIIGRTGASLKTDIQKECINFLLKQKKAKEEAEKYANNLTLALSKLVDLGLLNKGEFTLKTTVVYYEMTSIGNAVFYNIEHKEAVPSHFSRVTAAHSSAKHGYGIVGVAEVMRKYPDRFLNISEFNKEADKHLITHIEVDGETQERKIEPDIIFEEKFTDPNTSRKVIEERYIEYELVTQTKDEYFVKLEKYIMRGTKELFFIFPNGTLKKAFTRYVNQYLTMKKEKGIDFSDIKFYLYTFEEFTLMCEEGTSWKPESFEEEVEEVKEEPTFEEKTKGKASYTKKPEITNEQKAADRLFSNKKVID